MDYNDWQLASHAGSIPAAVLCCEALAQRRGSHMWLQAIKEFITSISGQVNKSTELLVRNGPVDTMQIHHIDMFHVGPLLTQGGCWDH